MESFNFRHESGVVHALEFAATALANQTIPVANALGIKSTAQGVINLEVLKMRYYAMLHKYRKDNLEPPQFSLFDPKPALPAEGPHP